MKNNRFYLLLVAIVMSACCFISCDKEETTPDPKTAQQNVVNLQSKGAIPFNITITDENGNTWTCRGTIIIKGSGATNNATITAPDGSEYRIRGSFGYGKKNGKYFIFDFEGQCTDKNGDTVVLDNIDELLGAVLESVLDSEESKSSSNGFTISETNIQCTDENGNPVELENLEWLLETVLNEVIGSTE